MTDEELDRLIDKLKPEIRVAVWQMLSGAAVHSFDLANLEGGVDWPPSVTVFFANGVAAQCILDALVAFAKDDRHHQPEHGID